VNVEENRVQSPQILITTTPTVAGYRIAAVYGQVFGVVVRSRGLAGNLMAGLRSIGGGEIKEYTQLLEQTRLDALARMSERAVAMGANAVVSMRFDSSAIGDIMSEIVAYGTAVGVVADPTAQPGQPQE
jgi:uncharacterized protein YbjQ (UPF0145 family)